MNMGMTSEETSFKYLTQEFPSLNVGLKQVQEETCFPHSLTKILLQNGVTQFCFHTSTFVFCIFN